MICDECGLAVETDYGKFRTQEEVDRHVRPYLGDVEVETKTVGGTDLTLDEVGSYVEVDNGDGSSTEWHVSVRVDHCVNCTSTLRVWTFCEHWDMSNKGDDE